MQPISGRIPDDLYQWLATVDIDGAKSISDKLRAAVIALRESSITHVSASEAMAHQTMLVSKAKTAIDQLNIDTGMHSEILSIFVTHLPQIMANLVSCEIDSVENAKRAEDQLVRRLFTLCESILKQAITSKTNAYDPRVVHRNTDQLLELMRLIDVQQSIIQQGENHHGT